MDAPDAACRATSGIQPLVGDVKILLPNEKSVRKVRHLRPRRNFQSNPGPSNSHEIRLPHRCTDALAQARCGPARVRTARCADAPNQQAELFRHHHHRLILSHRGDRSPRSPEATRTPSGSSTRGRFRFGARTKESHESNAIASRSRSIRTLLVRGRETREGARMRRAWMLRHGRQADAIAHGLALSTRRQCGASTNDPQRYGLACPSGARGTAVAYAGDLETVLHEATLAQLGRAAAKAVGRRFDSGTSHMDSSNG